MKQELHNVTDEFQHMEDVRVKEYKLVYLNKGLKMSREKDLEQAQEIVNEYVADGWELQEIVSPSDMVGALVGVFFKEK